MGSEREKEVLTLTDNPGHRAGQDQKIDDGWNRDH